MLIQMMLKAANSAERQNSYLNKLIEITSKKKAMLCEKNNK